jgi:hypothetical protein
MAKLAQSAGKSFILRGLAAGSALVALYLSVISLSVISRSRMHYHTADEALGLWIEDARDVGMQHRRGLACLLVLVEYLGHEAVRVGLLGVVHHDGICLFGWDGIIGEGHHRVGADTLRELSAGRIPPAWAPLQTTTTDEAVFLAPLDHVSAHGRAKVLFSFDNVWELYELEQQRKYGYHGLPALWGDRLVARFDSKLDRATNTFVILGFWLEDAALGGHEAFAEALARGFMRFLTFLGASNLDVQAIHEPLLRQRIETLAEASTDAGQEAT